MQTEEKRSFERYWDQIRYPERFLMGKHAEHPSRVIIADLSKEYGYALECGCGAAVDYPLYVERGIEYKGLDLTQKLLDAAKIRHPEINLVQGSIYNIPETSNSIPTVYTRAVLEHLHPLEWPKAIREMWRVASKQIIIGLFKWSPDYIQYEAPETLPKVFANIIGHLNVAKILDELGANWRCLDTPKGYKVYRIYQAKKS